MGNDELTAARRAKVWAWLAKQNPKADADDLLYYAEKKWGKLKWGGETGYGEGLITCEFIKFGVKGYSDGNCTGKEALVDVVSKMLLYKGKKRV